MYFGLIMMFARQDYNVPAGCHASLAGSVFNYYIYEFRALALWSSIHYLHTEHSTRHTQSTEGEAEEEKLLEICDSKKCAAWAMGRWV